MDAGKTSHQGSAKARFKFVELRVIHNPANHFPYIVRSFQTGGHNTAQLIGIEQGRPGFNFIGKRRGRSVEARYRLTSQLQSMVVILSNIIHDTGHLAMDLGTAQLFGCHFFTGCRLNKWRPRQKDRALIAHNNAFIRHGWHISATGRTGAHHHRNLGDPLS